MRITSGIAAVAMAVLSVSAEAQSVQQIMNDAKAAAVRRAANVNNYTVVEEMGGMETTLYYEKKMMDGFPVFVPRTVSVGARGAGRAGVMAMPSDEQSTKMAAEMMTSSEFISKARMAGTETVDGKRAYKLVVDDMSQLEIVKNLAASAQGAVKPKTMTVYLDAAAYVPLKMEMKADVTMGAQTKEMSMTTLMQDYRTVQGVLLPYKRTVSTDAMAAMSPQERAQLDQMKAMLAQLPDAQRKMVEDRLAGLDGSGTVTTVKSVKVNTPPPTM